MTHINQLEQGFREAFLWVNDIDDHSIYDISDCTNQMIDILISDFLLLLNNEEIKELEKQPTQFGHWLALTSGGHGAGFFDGENEIVQGIDSKLDDNKLLRHECAYIDDGIIYADFYSYGK